MLVIIYQIFVGSIEVDSNFSKEKVIFTEEQGIGQIPTSNAGFQLKQRTCSVIRMKIISHDMLCSHFVPITKTMNGQY